MATTPGSLLRRVAAGAITLLALSSCSGTNSSSEPLLTTIAPAESTAAESNSPSATVAADPTDDTTTDTTPPLLLGPLAATVVATHPHDPDAFTQGLEVLGNGLLLEGTGLYGESDRRIVDIESGEVQAIVELDPAFFGEGITVVGDELLQLTWKAGVLLRSDVVTLEATGQDTYDGEGWGLCFDGSELAMSNGSSTLTFRDPDTFEPRRSVDVTLDGTPVERLNELECVNGQVLANVWLTDLIVVIDPATGIVVATLNGSTLRPDGLPLEESGFALNGIAHDPDTGRFYLTGKRWPVIYEVELSLS